MKKISCIISAFSACSVDNKEETVAPEKTIKYTFDSAYANTDQSAVNAYESLCKAVTEYKNEVRMNTTLFESVTQLFYTSFPLSALVKDISVNDDGSGLNIIYKEEEEQHLNKVNSFFEKTDEILRKCSEGTTNKGVFTVRLYNYIASSVVKSEDETVSCLDTVLKGEGNSFSYSLLFEYILRQKDIPTYHVIASDAVGMGWGITGAVIYDNIYYFDIMSEFFDNGGKQLKYFGMTTKQIKNEGLKDLVYTNRAPADDASDLKFDVCVKCVSWKLDGAKLLITTNNEEVVEVAL